ncbi:MAG: MerR family transcriptional regulator [Anaerolineae bacterium]
MFKIGDFSKLGQVSTRMLRHYDKLGLLVPEQIDEWTSYRYYTIQQLSRLHRIIALKDLGLSLQQISDLLGKDNELPSEQLRGMLSIKRSELESDMAQMQNRLAQVEARLIQLENEDEPSPYEIVVKPVESMGIASLKAMVPHAHEMGYYCDSMSNSLYRQLKDKGVRWSGPEMILYHLTEFQPTDLPIEVCIGLDELPQGISAENDDELEFRELPGHELVASLIYEGPFEEMTSAVLELVRWAGIHQHVGVGPMREIHRSGPAHPEKPTGIMPVVELQIPIAKIQQ